MGKSTAEAITYLAEKVSGEQVMQPNGTSNVLDAVLDALTGTEVPYESFPTVADAIEAAADMYPSGGGPELGAPGQCYYDSVEPTVDGELDYSPVIHSVYLGEQLVASATAAEPNIYLVIAAGLVVETAHDTGGTACAAYVCTVDDGLYTSVEPWDGTITAHADGDNTYWTFTMPELQEGEWLVLWPH